jgi:FixJ family two-component response regulator
MLADRMRMTQLLPTSLGRMQMMGSRHRVCVVDDNESIRESLDGLLQSADLQADTFCCAEDALAQLDVGRCGCVITDYQMGEVSGIEFARRLREMDRDIPILLITAFPSPEIRQKANSAGIEFLSKPFDGTVLLAIVQRILRKQ